MSELKKNLCNITSTSRNHVYEYLIILFFSLQSTKEGAWSINMTPAERAKVKSTLCHQFVNTVHYRLLFQLALKCS